MSGSRELPMPNVTRISNLNQAQATLLHCWTKLAKFKQEQSPTNSYAWSPTSVLNEKRSFQEWLERWEAAFGTFLSNAMPSMNSEDITLSRILKSNHLACTILASDSDPLQPDAFESESRAIIELAGAVLRSRNVADSPQETISNNDAETLTPTLDVKEPLLVVTSNCTHESMRNRASELLFSIY